MRIGLQTKLTVFFILCGVVPMLVAAVLGFVIVERASKRLENMAYEALQERATGQLSALLQAKRAHFESYLQTLTREAEFATRSPRLGQAFKAVQFGYRRFRQESGARAPAVDALREELEAFYEERFTREYGDDRAARSRPLHECIAEIDGETLALQYAFFLDNPPVKAAQANISTRYGAWQSEFGNQFQIAREQLGFFDVFLVEAETGEIIFSTVQRLDFGTSLRDGPFADTNAGEAFRRAAEAEEPGQLFFTDFELYFPTYDTPACFIAAPIMAEGRKLGVIVMQLTIEHINQIMADRAGLGETGEMLLIGPDRLLRSDSVLSKSPRYTVSGSFRSPDDSRIDNEATQAVFERGEQGIGTFRDQRGREALIAYAPVEVFGNRWCLLAKVDTAEAFEGLSVFQRTAFHAGAQIAQWRFALAVFTSVVMVLLSFAVTRPIVRPLRRTVDMFRSMAEGKGDLSQRLEVSTRDEIADLAYWFNTFMGKLQAVYEELEQKTQALEQYRAELEEYSRNLEQEIADRKRAEAEVLRREEYFKALIENAPDVIVVLDENEIPKYMSPSFKKTFGYTPDELVGKCVNDIVHPEDWGLRDKRREEAMRNPGVPVRAEYRVQRKDGAWIWVEATGTNFVEDHVVGGVVLNLRDITARKAADALMRNYSERLEGEVAERTAELRKKSEDLERTLAHLRKTQDQLITNEKMASLGALTAGIAHEIRNPLNFINNFAELCEDLVRDLVEEFEAHKEALPVDAVANATEILRDLQQNSAKIREHGSRADSIVRSMLLHSRGKAGQRQKTDLNALLDEYVKLAYHGMRAKEPTFTVDIETVFAENLQPIEVVPQDIARVLLNVVGNACHAVHQRRLEDGTDYKPRIRATTVDGPRRAEIRIWDNGPGIPEDIQDKVFTPFFTTKPAGEGTGLGLSISYDIVVGEHQGELLVNSKAGEYAEFIIRLPKK